MGNNITKRPTFVQSLILLMLFFVTLDLVNRHFYFVYIAFALYLFILGRRMIINYSFAMLALLSLAIACFSPSSYESIVGFIRSFSYPMCYVIGYGLCSQCNCNEDLSKVEKLIMKIIVVIVAGAFFHYTLNWIINFSADSRNTVDFWSGKVLVATNQAAMACMALAVNIACLFSKSNTKMKILSWVSLLVILIYNLTLAGRTLIIMSLLVIAVAVIHRLKNDNKGRVKFAFLIICLIFLVLLAYNIDLFDIKTIVENSELYDRFFGEYSQGMTEDTRIDNKSNYIKHMFDYPFGGANLRSSFGYAHDIFLDTFDEAGWISLFAIFFYIVSSVSRLNRIIKTKLFSFGLRQVILCLYVVFYMEFMLEPVLQASPWLFEAFCIIDGSLCALLDIQKANVLSKRSKG